MLALAWATAAPSLRCWDSMTLGTAMPTGSSILSGWAYFSGRQYHLRKLEAPPCRRGMPSPLAPPVTKSRSFAVRFKLAAQKLLGDGRTVRRPSPIFEGD